MAKDVLINVRSGDVLLDNSNGYTDYMEVVWGSLFGTDVGLYMNIVVPHNKDYQIKFSGGKQLVYVHCPYHPECEDFNVRLVKRVGQYSYEKLVDAEFPAFCKESIDSQPRRIGPSELPVINIDGNFLIYFRRDGDEDLMGAYFYSAYRSDFKIGEADVQSAQLLSLCAPGKYYRFPTIGVDVTKYINTVVGYTDLASKLDSEFKGDMKTVSDATFDSETGSLDVLFNGANEEDGGNLVPVENLDIELLKIADDDFVKTVVGEMVGECDFELAIIDFESLDGLWGAFSFGDMKAVRKYDSIIYGKTFNVNHSAIVNNGFINDDIYTPRGDYQIVEVNLKAGSLVQFRWYENYDCAIPFILTDSNNRVIYHYRHGAYDARWYNEDCYFSAIILVDCTMRYALHRSRWSGYEEDGYSSCGVYVVEPDADKLKDFLVVVTEKISSRLVGYVTTNSNIKKVSLGAKSGLVHVEKIKN